MDAMQQLLDIMARLRDPQDGCPWDQRQTYATIVPYTLEEAYEVADAIQRGDMDELRDELGDLLFQVVFYSQIASEEGHFAFDDVARGICAKMIRRHPHVFGDAVYETDAQLRHAWEQAKADERAGRDAAPPAGRAPGPNISQLDGVARALPALIRAEKLQKRAARVGFDWPDVRGALDKTREEFDEVEAELRQAEQAQPGSAPADGGSAATAHRADADRLQDELGDLLFAMVNVLRLVGMDAEQTLSRANEKFERRFRAVENRLAGQGNNDLRSLSLDQLDAAWDQVKHEEKGT